jgi:hypothetical protein
MTRRAALSLIASAAVPMMRPKRITIDDIITQFLERVKNGPSWTAASFDDGHVEQTVVIHRRKSPDLL